jgi:hypothetical protein
LAVLAATGVGKPRLGSMKAIRSIAQAVLGVRVRLSNVPEALQD